MIPGSDLQRLTDSLEKSARGSAISRRLAFGLLTAFFWIKGASRDPVEIWRWPAVMLLAVLGLEITIVVLRRGQRDRGLDGVALRGLQRRDTLIATAVLAGVLLLSAAIFDEVWYGLLALLFAYTGFMFSRYVPEALFGAARKTA